MAFDQQTRNRLARFVSDARTLLSDEFTRQLQNDYGLDPNSGDVADMAKLGHLDDARQATARLLRDTMQHYLSCADTSTAAKAKKARQEVLNRIVREQAFTVLNRLCALRMAEARELLLESVANGFQSKGFQLYSRPAGTALGEKGDAYRCYLFSVFDELAVDLPVLFDRFSPQGRLFPRESVLVSLLELINHADLEPLWPEDETIGWIYQYFNSPEERRQMRAESQAPRNSRELAVRNQFFTPRYVVEFLTDNTLGRIWYEMTQGQTSLKDTCRYLVRRPDEVFLGPMTDPEVEIPAEGTVRMAILLQEGLEDDWPEFEASDESIQSMIDMAHCVDGYARHPLDGEDDWFAAITKTLRAGAIADLSTQDLLDGLFMTCRADRHGGDGSVYSEDWFIAACGEVRTRALRSRDPDLSQEELLRQPVFVPYRPLKDPREIRMLDPACGSMHFGLYAFDLFEQIYDEHFSGRLAADKEGEEESEPPGEERPQPIDYPHLIIERNIHGIDIDPRAVQIAGLSLWLRAQRTWRDQGIKAHSRPKVERSNVVCAEPMPGESEMLAQFTDQLRPTVLRQLITLIFEKMTLAGEAGSLLRISDEIADAVKTAHKEYSNSLLQQKKEKGFLPGMAPPREASLFDFADLPDSEHFWNQAEAIVLAALKDYAENATHEGAFQQRLFARDAASGFAFIDVCRQRYDVVLMNPPFGSIAASSTQYLKTSVAKVDIFAAFVEHGITLLERNGVLGAITPRSAMFIGKLENWRSRWFLGNTRLAVLADLGHGVLDDALVEACAYVVAGTSSINTLTSIRLLDAHSDAKGRSLATAVHSLASSRITSSVYVSRHSFFRDFPAARIPYWAPHALLSRIGGESTLASNGVVAKRGLSTGDDFRFLRCLWEVPISNIGTEKDWVILFKGGEYSPYYGKPHLCVYWRGSGAIMAAQNEAKGSLGSNIWMLGETIEKYYYRPGITWPMRTTSGFSPQALPAGCVFGDKGTSAFPPSERNAGALLAISMATPVRYGFELLVAAGDEVTSGSAARSYITGDFESLASPPIADQEFETAGRRLSRVAREQFRDDETCVYFDFGDVFVSANSLLSSTLHHRQRRLDRAIQILQISQAVDDRVSALLSLSSIDQDAVREILGPHPLSYPYSPVCEDDVLHLWQSDDSGLVAQAIAHCGARRYLTKKVYFADRQLEVMSHTLRISPEALAETIRRFPATSVEIVDRAKNIVSACVGIAFGRWDIRRVRRDQACNTLSDPFSELPVVPPAFLTGMGVGGEASPDVGDDYAVDVPWSGIVSGNTTGANDLARRVRIVLQNVFGEDADQLEHDLAHANGANTLAEYLNGTTGFFDDHLRRYSISRRSAPIYWAVSTASGSYTFWIYYPRLSGQTLYGLINDFIEPMLRDIGSELGAVRDRKQRTVEEEEVFTELSHRHMELAEFRREVLAVAAVWKPDLNDGVQISAAPLWKLFPHRAWQNKLRETWERLEAGDYDWAHLAMSIWPTRVVPKCMTDRSLAIAHDLEDLFWVEDIGTWRNLNEPVGEIEIQKQSQRRAVRGRVCTLLETMSSDHTNERAGDVFQQLVGGEWDDHELALLVWPNRVADKCWDDAILATKLKVKLPDRRTKANRKRFVEGLISKGCPELADQLAAAFECHDEPLGTAWDELVQGIHDEQPLALSLWPDRVVDKCTEDVELAQAHNIQRFFWVQHPTEAWRRRISPETEVANEIERRKGQS